MNVDGHEIHAYVLQTDGGGEVVGLDARTLRELEVEWLARWAETGKRMAAAEHRARKSAVLDERLVKKVVEGAGEFTEVGEEDVEGLRPVEAVTPTSGEILRLLGVPSRGGVGSASHLASEVCGIACATDGPGILGAFLAGESPMGSTSRIRRRRRGETPFDAVVALVILLVIVAIGCVLGGTKPASTSIPAGAGAEATGANIVATVPCGSSPEDVHAALVAWLRAHPDLRVRSVLAVPSEGESNVIRAVVVVAYRETEKAQ